MKSFLKICIVYFFINLNFQSFAVQENYPSGARFSGLSNAGVTIIDLWSNYHNQAALAFYDRLSFGFHWENKFVVPQYSQNSFALAIPTNSGTIGASYTFFGFSEYNESKIGLAFGKAFGRKFSAGIQLNYINVHQEIEYGNVMTLAVEAGLLFRPWEKISIGAHVYNPNRVKFKQLENERVPTTYQFGIGYQINKKLFLLSEVEKNLDNNATVMFGGEYQVLKPIVARLAVTTDRYSVYSFGLGFIHKKILADIAFSQHQILGFTPHLSINYSFK